MSLPKMGLWTSGQDGFQNNYTPLKIILNRKRYTGVQDSKGVLEQSGRLLGGGDI